MQFDETIIVGDLHGRVEVAQDVIKNYVNHYNVVFVGDYLDSYDRSSNDCLMTLMRVLDAQRDHDNVKALIGNHEWSYLWSSMQCSGFDPSTNEFLHSHKLKDRMLNELLEYVWLPLNVPVLITHAGLSLNMFDHDKVPTREEIDDMLQHEARYAIGRSRGGPAPCGGIFWCDYYRDFKPIPGIAQVFGHSRQPHGITQHDEHNWAIDCLEPRLSDTHQVLLYRLDGSAEPVDV